MTTTSTEPNAVAGAAIPEVVLHAAMDAFYPGEDWRVALGSALPNSLRDMRAAIAAATALATPTIAPVLPEGLRDAAQALLDACVEDMSYGDETGDRPDADDTPVGGNQFRSCAVQFGHLRRLRDILATPASSPPPVEGEESHNERMARLKREWSNHVPLDVSDHTWLLMVASKKFAQPRPEAAADGLRASSPYPYTAAAMPEYRYQQDEPGGFTACMQTPAALARSQPQAATTAPGEGCDWCLSLAGKIDPHRSCAKCAPTTAPGASAGWADAATLRTALEGLYDLCTLGVSEDAFRNGVTDSTGTIDEGDVRAGERIDAARIALAALTPAVQPEPAASPLPWAGSRKWGADFPPSCCNAFEDCAHDGFCHDMDQCGARGPGDADE